jgi:hypothetical protein
MLDGGGGRHSDGIILQAAFLTEGFEADWGKGYA